jgi:hypothetical protein
MQALCNSLGPTTLTTLLISAAPASGSALPLIAPPRPWSTPSSQLLLLLLLSGLSLLLLLLLLLLGAACRSATSEATACLS